MNMLLSVLSPAFSIYCWFFFRYAAPARNSSFIVLGMSYFERSPSVLRAQINDG